MDEKERVGLVEEENKKEENDVPADPCTESSNTDNGGRRQSIRNGKELNKTLELMYDRCVSRNLRAAGLGGFDKIEDQKVYGNLDANTRMSSGEPILIATLFHVEDTERQYRYVAILMNEGADPNMVDDSGKTALMIACIRGLDKSAKVMMQFERTELLKKDPDGNTALHYIVVFGRDKLLRAYFKYFRKYNEKEQSSTTDLRNSVTEDPLDIKNSAGETAQSIALKNHDYLCVQLINEEKMRTLKVLNKRIGMIHHSKMTPILSRRTVKETRKKFLHHPHHSSFDSLLDQPPERRSEENSSEEELLGSGNSSEFTHAMHRLKYALKYRSQPEHLNRQLNTSLDDDASSKDSITPPPELSINVGVRLINPRNTLRGRTRPNNRREKVQGFGKSESVGPDLQFSDIMCSNLDSDTQGYAAPFPVVMEAPVNSGPVKSKVSDRIRNFLRRRPKYEVASIDYSNPNTDFEKFTTPHQFRRGTSQPDLNKNMNFSSSLRRDHNKGQPKLVPRSATTEVNLNLSTTSEVLHSSLTDSQSPTNSETVDQVKEKPRHDKPLKQSKGGTKRELSLPPIRQPGLLRPRPTEPSYING